MIVLMISRSTSKLRRLGNKKLGHRAKSKEHFVYTLEVIRFEAIIMDLAQNVFLDAF